MAKAAKAASNAVGLNPAEMLQGGLKDDFRGKVSEAVFCGWDYDGNVDEPVLAVRLTIDVEDEDEPFVQHWSAGQLADFRPSEDGKDAVDEEDGEGPFCVRVGKRAQLNNNTNFAHLMNAVLDCGRAAKLFSDDDLTASLECLVGIDAQWNRVPQKKRSGMVEQEAEEGKKNRSRDILVPTTMYAYGEAVAKGGKKAAAKTASPKGKVGKAEPEETEDEAEESEVSPLDAKLYGIVKEILDAKPGKPFPVKKLAPAVLAAMGKDKDKAKAIPRIGEDDFLESGGEGGVAWVYDEDAGTLTPVDEE